MSITTNASKKGLFDGRKMWFIFSGACALVVIILAFVIMSGVMAKDTYYVLSEDIPARTQITPALLVEVSTAAGTTPPSALGIADITEETFSLYSLKAGDILTASNTGELLTLSEGLPADYVVASFTASPSMAAGGNVKRGDYIDVMAIADDTMVTGEESIAASYVLQRVLVIDATVDLDSYSAESETAPVEGAEGEAPAVSDNTNDPAIRSGIPTMFTVGLSQDNAAVLAVATQYQLYVVLSSAESVNDGTVGDNLTPAAGGSIWGGAVDAGQGTDNTFGQGGAKVETPNKPSAPTEPVDEPSTPTEPTPDESTNPDEPVEGDSGTEEDTGGQ